MKNNKIKTLVLVVAAILVQSSSVYAASTKTKDEDLDNITPGFQQEDIQKSNDRVNSFTNTFTGSQVKEDNTNQSTTNNQSTTANSGSGATTKNNIANTILSTQTSTGVDGDFWGITKEGKWILIEQGVPVIGWEIVNGSWYYMDANGVMQTGWLNYNGEWYYLKNNGQMAANTIIDGYILNSDGALI